jgi:hypothetical protein
MANTRTARSFPLAAWLFVASGILFLLELLLSHVGVTALDVILVFLAYLALAVAFVILFLWRSVDLLLRVAFVVAAVGWALLALDTLTYLGAAVVTIAEILALAGTLVAGIIAFIRRVFGRRSGIAFLVLAIVAAIWLLTILVATGIGATFALILAILFGAMLVVAGFFMTRRW